MQFALNGRALQTPDAHKWVIPQSYGTSGQGRPLFAGVLAYELNWPILTQTEFDLLVEEWATGSVVATLPRWQGLATAPEYESRNYSGTYLSMPEWQTYLDGNYKGVRVLINNVTV